MTIELPPGTAAERPDRNPPPSGGQFLKLLALLVAGILFVIWLVGVVANQLVWWIPPEVEQQLGQITVPYFEKLAPPSATQTGLNSLLDEFEALLPPDQSQRDYQLLYIPESTVNALAIPGDRVVIYQGLLELMESENELMMVLAHELGHFANRDHLRSLGRGVVWQLVLGGMVGDLSGIQRLVVGGVEQFSQAQFSQAQETQADEFGLELLNQHYGHVAGATDFFARLARQRRGGLTDFVASHPSPRKRVKQIRRLGKKRGYREEKRIPLPVWE